MRQLIVSIGAFIALLSASSSAVAQEYGGLTGSNNNSLGSGSGSSRSRSNRSNFESSNEGITDFGGSSRSEGRSSRRNRNGTPTPRAGAKTDGTPVPGSKATPGSGKELKSAKGKKAPSGKSSSSGEARAATNVEFKMKANPSTNLLYIEGIGVEPTLNILTTEGEEFVTRVFFVNARGSRYKTFSIALKYDPSIITPVGIDDSDVSSLLENDAAAHVDAKRGIITYKAVLKQPRTDPARTVFKVQWKSLTPTSDAAISFINNDKFRSNVLDDEEHNVLLQRDESGEIEASDKAGLVDAAVSVMPSAQTSRALSDDEGSFSAISLANNISRGTAEGGVILELRPRRQSSIRVGEDFLVDLVFSNPRHAELDTMKVKLRFDPAVLQVVDYDTDNWITRGINLFDGDYHDDLPFDYHRKNTVSNSTGIIEYDMGFAARVRVPVQGTIATIRMRAVAPAAATPITFVYDDTPEAEPQTAVTFLGFNLVGSPGERAAALRSVDVSISNL
ncbi:MAG: hypothetical protein ACR2IE_04190 [Candidatus Sumerlaeaceae bacterium]